MVSAVPLREGHPTSPTRTGLSLRQQEARAGLWGRIVGPDGGAALWGRMVGPHCGAGWWGRIVRSDGGAAL